MPKFVKGSEEAKEHMAKLRSMRGQGQKLTKKVSVPKEKPAHMIKGSEEARAHMAKLREMRKSKMV